MGTRRAGCDLAMFTPGKRMSATKLRRLKLESRRILQRQPGWIAYHGPKNESQKDTKHAGSPIEHGLVINDQFRGARGSRFFE